MDPSNLNIQNLIEELLQNCGLNHSDIHPGQFVHTFADLALIYFTASHGNNTCEICAFSFGNEVAYLVKKGSGFATQFDIRQTTSQLSIRYELGDEIDDEEKCVMLFGLPGQEEALLIPAIPGLVNFFNSCTSSLQAKGFVLNIMN